jgi:hypothetical protein
MPVGDSRPPLTRGTFIDRRVPEPLEQRAMNATERVIQTIRTLHKDEPCTSFRSNQ